MVQHDSINSNKTSRSIKNKNVSSSSSSSKASIPNSSPPLQTVSQISTPSSLLLEQQSSRSCCEFSESSNPQSSSSSNNHNNSVGGGAMSVSRIPLFNVKSGYLTSNHHQSRQDSNCQSEKGVSVPSKLRRLTLSRSIPEPSMRRSGHEAKTFVPDVTPLPFLRRDILTDISSTSDVVPKTEDHHSTPTSVVHLTDSFGLSSTGTCITNQSLTRPNSTATSASTTASLRDRHQHASIAAVQGGGKAAAVSSILLTPSTIDTLRTKLAESQSPAADDSKPEERPPSRLRSSKSLFLSILVILICFSSGLLFVFNEFSSGRCWSTEVVDSSSSAPQRVIICSDDSIFHLIPKMLQPHMHLKVLDPTVPRTSSSISKIVFNASHNTVHQVHRVVLRMTHLFGTLSLPQQQQFVVYYLRKLADKIDESSSSLQQDDTVIQQTSEAPLNLLNNIQQRISAFESSGLIEIALKNSTASLALQEHTNEFKQRIEHANDNVYVAIGYGLANVIIIDTPKGLILFDTLENPSNMRRVMKDWNKLKKDKKQNSLYDIEDPPILAILFSHFHSDHLFGASAVYQKGVTQIWAHETTDIEISKVFTMTAGTTYKRSMRQFGSLLSETDGYINAGIGLRLDYDASEVASAVRPTHIWKGDRTTIEIGGEVLELIHAPGESKDQSIVWFPKKELLFGADNIYKSFPNIYAIRGTESRDAMLWVKSLDIMRGLHPKTLVLGHTGILRGHELIYSTITSYRDAIQFIHDQTVRYMNKGHPVNDIVEIIKLPPRLRSHPYLQPFYGTVQWAVRAIFHHYVGWFSGLSEELYSLSRSDRAAKLAEIVGGRVKLLQIAIEALEKEEYQWALELVSHAQLLSPNCEITRQIKTNVLRILATTQTSAPGRNWYLTAARESAEQSRVPQPRTQMDDHLKYFYQKAWKSGKLLTDHLSEILGRRSEDNNKMNQTRNSNDLASSSSSSHPIHRRKISDQLKVTKSQKDQCIKNLKSAVEIFSFIPIRMKAEVALNIEAVLSFTFTDTQQSSCIHFRHGIAYAAQKCERKPDLTILTTDETWRLIITYELRPLVAIARGKLRVDSKDPLDYLRLKRLLGLIEIDME